MPLPMKMGSEGISRMIQVKTAGMEDQGDETARAKVRSMRDDEVYGELKQLGLCK